MTQIQREVHRPLVLVSTPMFHADCGRQPAAAASSREQERRRWLRLRQQQQGGSCPGRGRGVAGAHLHDGAHRNRARGLLHGLVGVVALGWSRGWRRGSASARAEANSQYAKLKRGETPRAACSSKSKRTSQRKHSKRASTRGGEDDPPSVHVHTQNPQPPEPQSPPPVLRSGNTNTLALPATSEWVLTFTRATAGSMAASY